MAQKVTTPPELPEDADESADEEAAPAEAPELPAATLVAPPSDDGASREDESPPLPELLALAVEVDALDPDADSLLLPPEGPTPPVEPPTEEAALLATSVEEGAADTPPEASREEVAATELLGATTAEEGAGSDDDEARVLAEEDADAVDDGAGLDCALEPLEPEDPRLPPPGVPGTHPPSTHASPVRQSVRELHAATHAPSTSFSRSGLHCAPPEQPLRTPHATATPAIQRHVGLRMAASERPARMGVKVGCVTAGLAAA